MTDKLKIKEVLSSKALLTEGDTVGKELKNLENLENVFGKDYDVNKLSNMLKDLDMAEIESFVGSLLDEVKSLSSKGYVNKFELGSGLYQPYLKEYLLKLVDGKHVNCLNMKEQIEVGKWSYNMMMLDIYLILTEKYVQIQDKNVDQLRDIDLMIREIFIKLDPSIRIHLRKSGMSIYLNTYTGFDTEYQKVDSMTNKLLSVQLAVSGRVLLKIPLTNQDYVLSSIDPLKGTIYKEDTVGSRIKYDKLISFITTRVKKVREINFKIYDESMGVIERGLKELDVPYMIKERFIIFKFEKSSIRTWFFSKITDGGVSLEDVIKKSNDMSKPWLNKELVRLYELLQDIHNNALNPFGKLPLIEESERDKLLFVNDVNIDINNNNNNNNNDGDDDLSVRHLENSKKYTRTNKQSFSKEKIIVNKISTNYLISHNTSADLSMLNDFEKYKKDFDIVNGTFVTLKKPLLLDNVNIVLRDTMLLAPGVSKSLASIGSLYENLRKIDIGKKIEDMESFLKEDLKAFKEYALQDSLICLFHGIYMEDYNFRLGVLGIPLSLSSLSAAYLRNKWSIDKYKGYQPSKDYLIGDASKTQTPKGLSSTGSTALNLSLYIGNYKGGRNESYMYGIDNTTEWIDYDLTSAYTTGMAFLGDPDYRQGKRIDKTALGKMSTEELIKSYIIIKGSFKFPNSVKFPSIPCFVDKDITVYPLEGKCVLTGSEYVLAKEQKCYIAVEEVFYIPFKKPVKNSKGEIVKSPYMPFYSVIKELQSQRSKYVKGTIDNLTYKELGNSLYGLVVKGISNKMKFDTRVGATVRMEGNAISNPIMASWITAFIRSVLGEVLHNTSNRLKGRIVSATTDGFITDIKDLENKLVNLKEGNTLLKTYRSFRNDLSKDPTGLETKKGGVGIISWTTRGQFSKDAGLMAATGFQKSGMSFEQLEQLFKDTMNSEDKEMIYIHQNLRSALDIFKKGGHVTKVYKDKVFRMQFDNKRVIRDINSINSNSNSSSNNTLLDSSPVKSIKHAEMLRFFGKLPKVNIYQKNLNVTNIYKNTYKDLTDVAVRNFVRCLLAGSMNLDKDHFKNYNDIVAFINAYDANIKMNANIVALLKRRSVKPKKLLRNESTEKFVKYVLKTFPNFNTSEFFGN